jgi:hypothetical protein
MSEFAEQLGRCLLTRLSRRISIIPASILCGVVCQEKRDAIYATLKVDMKEQQ